MTEPKDDWFDNVENLKPVRGGRRAGTLNSVSKNAFHVTDKEAEAKFRVDWEEAKNSEDPLKVLWRYSVWFDEHFPSGKPCLWYPMLYKICVNYGNDERYQHDERLLKFWIMLAENFPERGLAVFDFAYSRGSLRTMAKFYVRWSEMYDNLGNMNKARDRLDFGLKNRATPISVIHEAQKKLEFRLMRDTLRQQPHNVSDHEEQDMDYGEDLFTPCAPRKQLAKLKGVGEKSEAPMFRIPKGLPGTLRLPQKNVNESFEIYEDVPDTPQTPIVATSKKTGRIADEFIDDPEFQALFGFFDHRSQTNIHLNISENVRKPGKKMGLKELPQLPAGDDFEVFKDGDAAQEKDDAVQEKRAPFGDKRSQSRIQLRKEICQNETSIEELYAQMINNKRI